MAIKEKDKILEINTLEIPEQLKELPKWVLWRAEWNEKQQQFSKVPYSFAGYRASSTKKDTWTLFNPIYTLYEQNNKYDGIGFVLSDDDEYIVLDIDNAVDFETKELKTDLAHEMVQLTYCELSPSGTGLHCFFKGELPKERKKKRTDLDIELYDNSRFMTVTGESIGQSEICEEQATINNIVERYFRPDIKINYVSNENNHSIFTDKEVINLMLNSVAGKKIKLLLQGEYEKANFDSPSEAVQSLLHYLAFYTGKDKQQMERIFLNYNNLTNKWYDKRGNSTWGENELDTAIEHQSTIYEPNSSHSSLSLKEMIKNVGREERQRIKEVFEKEQSENGKGGKCPDRISSHRCAVILDNLMKFILIEDIQENSKLAMYLSSEGIYTQNYGIIKRIISWLEPKHPEKKAEEIIYYLKNKADVIPLTNNPDLIPVNNGVFNRKTKKLESFTPNYIFTTKISTNYVSEPKPPRIDGWDFDNWLDEIACGDMEVSTLLWQVINDSLNGNYTRKKAIFLVGKGNNGKGTFQEMLSNLIGADNVASLKVNEFDHEFKLSVLEGKTCVIGDDVPVGIHIDDSSNFKSVVTGDYVLVNVKNRQPYRASFRCTVIQSTNGMPKFKDKTDGIIRRLLIVPFKANFNGQKENIRIKEEYLKDKRVLEYILYKAINLDFKKFITPSVSDEMLDEYMQDNDPIYDFKVEEFDIWNIDKVPKSIVYDKYKNFCENNGFLHLSERKFHKSFKEYLGNSWKEGRPRYYSINDLRSKIGHFNVGLLDEGEQTRSYIKV